MNIVQIVRAGDKMGGIAQVARQYHFLASVASSANNPIFMRTLVDSPPLTFEQHFADLGAIHLDGTTKGIWQFSPRTLVAYADLLKGADIVIAHTGTCLGILRMLGKLSSSWRAPIVGVAHNDNRIPKTYRYDGMICLTLDQAERIQKLSKRCPLDVVPNPLGANDFSELQFSKKIEEISPQRANIGVACNLISKKNVRRLLHEFAHLLASADRAMKCHLHIAGDGNERMALEVEVKNLGIHDQVTFHGWIDAKNRPSFFKEIDILWHAATIEPFGLVLVEGAYYGCHVQAGFSVGAESISRIDGVPELQVIDQEAPIGEFAKAAITRLEDYKGRSDSLISARHNALTHYGAAAIAPRWYSALLRLAVTPSK